MTSSRRTFMSLFAALPAVVIAGRALAFETVDPSKMPAGLNVTPAGGLWTTLVHATDGTNPSTTVTNELPHFTPAIRDLSGKTVELEGYLTPVGTGFGKSQYILGQMPFHCSFCYPQGRASLALVEAAKPFGEKGAATKVKVRGTLALQGTTPDDFYYQIKDAALV